jgi:3-deoxy-D-manno-octulosonic-acid transferase
LNLLLLLINNLLKLTALYIFFYNIFLLLYRVVLFIASFINVKAKKWVSGRKDLFQRLRNSVKPDDKLIWMHCASLGEFEQGRPVLEKIRSSYPGYKILLTFFSPSGYEVQKNYPGADWVFYLPMDGPKNARRFLEITHPCLVIFVKYEFWYYYLKKIKYRKIPLLLISAIFRPEMPFFKWYGGTQRKILSRFDYLFVQDNNSKNLLDEIGFKQMNAVSGDTRFDRVSEIAEKFIPIPEIERFVGDARVIVAGSTWPEDEEMLEMAFPSIKKGTKLIIAPHETGENNIKEILKRFPEAMLLSAMQGGAHLEPDKKILIIDNVGMLSRIYKYAAIAYIGGGLKSSGVHNVLEAAVYSKPVIIGPFYKKYLEATQLVKCKGALVIRNENEFIFITTKLLENENNILKQTGATAGGFVEKKTGATKIIMKYIQEKRLLTN